MTQLVQDGNGNEYTAGRMLSVEEYAAKADVSTRTVKKWLAGDGMYSLPAAEKVGNRWQIPEDAVRVLNASSAETTQPQDHSSAPLTLVPNQGAQGGQLLPWQAETDPTLREDLDDEPGYLKVETAARYLGIPQAQILKNPERFGLEDVGVNGALRVPQRVVRRIMGY